MIVAGALGTVLNLMGTAYGRALGPGRIFELVEFKRELIQSVLNTEVSGLLESQEPAVIKAVADLLRASIPDVAS